MYRRYGKGPFYVQFFVRFPGYTDKESFVVELPSLWELPHSVSTFLELVHSKLYDGTAFLANTGGSKGILKIGGNPVEKESARLERRYKQLGYEDSALYFTETSPANYPCTNKYSVGFVGRGPGLEIYLSSASGDNGDASEKTCFGRVVRGMKILNRLDSITSKSNQAVDIVEVVYLAIE